MSGKQFVRHLRNLAERKPKEELRALQQQRLKNAFVFGQRLALDFGVHVERTTDKDRRKLVIQSKLLYESNRNSVRPFALTFAELKRDSAIFSSFKENYPSFEDNVVNVSEKPVSEIFNFNEIIYLTPDSPETLQELDIKKVYVLGGLVDFQVTKNVTQNKASKLNIETRRLPIPEYMDRREGRKYNYSKILSINQVFDILMAYQETRDWRTAIPFGLPARKGYIPKPITS